MTGHRFPPKHTAHASIAKVSSRLMSMLVRRAQSRCEMSDRGTPSLPAIAWLQPSDAHPGSAGEKLVGPCSTLYMDEISTGLDSSTTFLIVKCIRNFVHMAQGTVLMALLQPAPEVYDLFDDIMLLCEGESPPPLQEGADVNQPRMEPTVALACWRIGRRRVQIYPEVKAHPMVPFLCRTGLKCSYSRSGLQKIGLSANGQAPNAAAGQVVFHGPKDEAMPFFNSLGFELPGRKGIADFLQEVTSEKDQKVGDSL